MKQSGMSLIELMVVLIIVSVLMMVAIPSYQNYVMRADRSEGLENLQAFMNAQERYYADNMEYAENLTLLGSSSNSFTTPRGLYVITVQKCGSLAYTQCVELIATAQGAQEKDGNLIFNSNGRQIRILGGTEYAL